MRKIFLVAVMAAILVGCGSGNQYTVSGKIEGLKGAVNLEDANTGETIASIETQGDEFVLKGKVSEPQIVIFSAPGVELTSIIVLEPGEIIVTADHQNGFKTSGTELNNRLTAINQTMVEISNDPEITPDDIVGFLLAETSKNKDNVLGGLFFVHLQNSLSVAEMDALHSQLSVSNQQHPGVIAVMDNIEPLRKSQVGQPFIPITMAQENGEQVALADVVAENKYTLVDFWASWCGPCMAEMPYLFKAYSDYHSKGFEIYAISLDRDLSAWVNTYTNYKLDWINVSSLVDGNRTAIEDYVITSIPANVLIDQSGTIIARDLRGADLLLKLEDLLK